MPTSIGGWGIVSTRVVIPPAQWRRQGRYTWKYPPSHVQSRQHSGPVWFVLQCGKTNNELRIVAMTICLCHGGICELSIRSSWPCPVNALSNEHSRKFFGNLID